MLSSQNFITGPMIFFKIYLNVRPTKHTMFLIQTLSLCLLSICTDVFFCHNSLSVHCETENVFSFEQEISTASCDLVPFYALHSLCSNFFFCVLILTWDSDMYIHIQQVLNQPVTVSLQGVTMFEHLDTTHVCNWN